MWGDNNFQCRPSAADTAAGYILQYSLDEGEYRSLTDANGALADEAKRDLHMDKLPGEFAQPFVDVASKSMTTYEATSIPLPAKLTVATTTPSEEEGGKPTTITEEIDVTWRLHDANDYKAMLRECMPEGEKDAYEYVDGTAEDGVNVKLLAGPISFTVAGRFGGMTLDEALESSEAKDFEFRYAADGRTMINSVAWAITHGKLAVDEEGPSQDAYTHVLSGKLPIYEFIADEEGNVSLSPVVYSIEYVHDPDEDERSGDWYQVEYNNSESANHGSATDAVYNGGTMTLRRMGYTTFEATKVWLDEDSGDRKPTTFSLWRYSTQFGPDQAAQVQVGSDHRQRHAEFRQAPRERHLHAA